MQFDCKMSRKSKVRIVGDLRKLGFHHKTQRGIQDLADMLNPKIRGQINYYGKISRRSLRPVFYYLHHRLIKWILNKYKRFKGSKVKAVAWLRRLTNSYPNLFYHWSLGDTNWSDYRSLRRHNKSRMNGEVHIRFGERFRGEIPLYLIDQHFVLFHTFHFQT